MKKVKKRDGRIVDFDSSKIINAVLAAFKQIDGEISEYAKTKAQNIADYIEGYYIEDDDTYIPGIEDIQDLVEKGLMSSKRKDVAKAYVLYREERTRQRGNPLDETIKEIVSGNSEYWNTENSNKNSKVVTTQRDYLAGALSTDMTRRVLLPKDIVEAHDAGIIHFHDADYFAQNALNNCCLINLEDMFTNGTVINEKMVETPKSFETACTVATQIIAQVSSNQYGGNSITIRHLAPYLRVSYDRALAEYSEEVEDKELAKKLAIKRRNKALKDGIQTIRYQLSTLSSVNGQSPFCTIYLEIEEGHKYEEEMALICEEMIKQRLEGMKNYKGQEIGEAFPKLVYLLDEHNCLEGGKYDYITKLSAKCNCKRLVPDYQSAKIMRKNYEGNTFPPMGCRSHLSPMKDENGNYKWYGRFNGGVISLNLPQIGILANKDMDLFWEILDQRLELCKEALLFRQGMLRGVKSDVSPIHWQHGAIARLKKGETIDKLLDDGYSTMSLGYVGICEMTYAMLGVSHTTPEGEKFALKVMHKLKDAVDSWKAETGIGFGLYGTPAEALIYRFCRLDKARFGEIKNVTDRMYYTNSYHVHVCEEIDAFDKLKFESQFHDISLGGCISYIEVPDMSKNLEAVEQIINYIYHNVQYAEINTKPDVCYKCGFTGEVLLDKDTLTWYCPNCGNKDKSELQVMRRTCGLTI